MRVTVVVGGQFGSEAKGAATAALTRAVRDSGQRVAVVRVAGPNAGHTAYDGDGVAWALRTVPVGMVAGDDVTGYIAAGSEVDIPVLFDEIDRLAAGGHAVAARLLIHPSVTLLTERHHQIETAVQLPSRIGSTGKGIGAARADRVMRKATTLGELLNSSDPVRTLRQMYPIWTLGMEDPAVVDRINALRRLCRVSGFIYPTDHLIVEGTQGYGLGLHTQFYPQCTSSDTTAGAFLAMAGVSSWSSDVSQVSVLVCARVYPIRVAGNSGPLQGETTWAELGLSDELTTVTKKVRRVGTWDPALIRNALRANGATCPRAGDTLAADRVFLALTMFDQLHSYYAGLNEQSDRDQINAALREAEQFCGYPVTYLGTGPNSYVWSPHRLRDVLGWEV